MVRDALSFTQGSALAVLAGASQRVGTAASPVRSGGATKGRVDYRRTVVDVINGSRLLDLRTWVRRDNRLRPIFSSQLFGPAPTGALA